MKTKNMAPLLGVVQPKQQKDTRMTNFLLFLRQIAWTPVFSVLLALTAVALSFITGLEGLSTILALSSASITFAILSINSKLG